jgi:predicted nucleic acid-binding protein
MTLIANTTILSNFALVQRPELIRIGCPEDVVTAAQVMEEIRRGVARQLLPACDWNWLPVRTLDTPEGVQLFEQVHRRLGQGEAACLALAMSRGFKFLSDDTDARRWGNRAGIPVSEMIGILVRLVQSAILTLAEGNALLTEMRQQGYYAPVEQLNDLL